MRLEIGLLFADWLVDLPCWPLHSAIVLSPCERESVRSNLG
jgi:hypothetical protein